MRFKHLGRYSTGLAMALGSVRTHKGWRVGEYPDLAQLGTLAASSGFSLIQLLPLNDSGGQSSPYFALSAHALHPLYIRVRDLPEAAGAPDAVRQLDDFAKAARAGERFPYHEALAVKISALRAVYDASAEEAQAGSSLETFIKDNDWVRPYAVYKRLKALNAERSWREWDDYRDPAPGDIERLWGDPALRREHYFHVWCQSAAWSQLGKAAAELESLGIDLMADLPILMNEDSADVWADRTLFRLDLRAGSPPDAGSPQGQNWGFPVYNREERSDTVAEFWKTRIRLTDRYASCYRLDHVLGFFRLWALPEREHSGVLGRFLPGSTITEAELGAAGFSPERVRWLSLSHISSAELHDAANDLPDASGAALAVTTRALERIGSEELFLFRKGITGERDIDALGLDERMATWLKRRWRDRTLVAVDTGGYVPAWDYRASRAWSSLSDRERGVLEALLSRKRADDERLWLEGGRSFLAMLKAESGMLPCAEDLGSIPPGVPETLADLGVLGLRLPRWTRIWHQAGQPFLPLSDYPRLSVCTPSVHDTSTLRGWWELEDGREALAGAYCPDLQPVPRLMDAGTELRVLKTLARAASLLYVIQMQDLLDLSDRYRSDDPSADRINVPGAVAEFNWTWRMGPQVEDLVSDTAWLDALRSIAAARPD